jgi:uncharacterized paraquat-inducible protein A
MLVRKKFCRRCIGKIGKIAWQKFRRDAMIVVAIILRTLNSMVFPFVHLIHLTILIMAITSNDPCEDTEKTTPSNMQG